MNIIHISGLIIAALAVSGCGTTTDDDYGQSVRQMVEAQTFDPAASSNPPELAPGITDGARLQNALDVYRKDVAKGNTEVKQPVIFEVGTN